MIKKFILFYFLILYSLFFGQILEQNFPMNILSSPGITDLGYFQADSVKNSQIQLSTVWSQNIIIDTVWSSNITITDGSIGDTISIANPQLISFSFTVPSSGLDTGYIYISSNAMNSLITETIVWGASGGVYELIADKSLIDFDTVSSYSQRSVVLSNSSTSQINDISYDGLSFPFGVSNSFSELNENSSESFNIYFQAVNDSTYTDTLILTSSTSNVINIVVTGTWSQDTLSNLWVYSGTGGGGWHQDIKVDPVNNGKIYVSTDLSGFWKTEDYGNTWTATNASNGGYEGSNLAVHPNGDTLLWGNNAGLWLSEDAGDTWTRLGEGQIYGEQTYERDLRLQSLGGEADSANMSSPYFHDANTDHIWVGTGTSHEVMAASGSIYSTLTALQTLPNPMRILKSEDYGSTWTDVTTSTFNTTTNAVGDIKGSYSSSNVVYVATLEGIAKTSNGGSSWNYVYSLGRCYKLAVNPLNHNYVAATRYSDGDDGVIYTTDGGISWINIGNNLASYNSRFSDVQWTSDGSKLYVSTVYGDSRIHYQNYSSITSTSDWISLPNTVIQQWEGSSAAALNISVSNDESVIVYGFGEVVVSVDGGDYENKSSTYLGNGLWKGKGTEVSVCVLTKANKSGRVVIQAHQDHGGTISYDYGNTLRSFKKDYYNDIIAISAIAFSEVDTNYAYFWAGTGVGANVTYAENGYFFEVDLAADEVSRIYTNVDYMMTQSDMIMMPSGRLYTTTYNNTNTLYTNGTFSSSSGWTLGTGWTISGGKANCNGSQTSTSNIYQSTRFENNNSINYRYTVSNYSSGSIAVLYNGTQVGTLRTANGTYSETLIMNGSYDYITFRASADFVGSIDDVTVTPTISDGICYSDPPYSIWTKIQGIHYGGKMAYDATNDILYCPQQARSNGSDPAKDYLGGIIKVSNASTSRNVTYMADSLLGNVRAVAVHPDSSDVLYAAINEDTYPGTNVFSPSGGIYKTSNGGTTWAKVFNSSIDKHDYTDVIIDPTNPSVVYASQDKIGRYADISASNGIIMSSDNGVSWSNICYNLPLRSVMDLEIVDNTGTLWASVNSAAAWFLSKTSLAISSPVITSFDIVESLSEQKVTASVEFERNNSNSISINWGVGLSPASISYDFVNTDVSGTNLSRVFNLDTSQTYYMNAIVKNELNQADTSEIDSTVWTVLTQYLVTDSTVSNRDDADWYVSGYNIGQENLNLRLGNWSPNSYNLFFLFDGITIPSGAIIDSSYLELTSRSSSSSSVVNAIFYGIDVASPSQFVDHITANAYTLTTASEVYDSISSETAEDIIHYDVTSIVRELVNSYSYNNGKMGFVGKDNNSSANAYRGYYSQYGTSTPGKNPKLYIYYSD